MLDLEKNNGQSDTYSDNLVGMIRETGDFLSDANIGGFIRDYEKLPRKTGFDIDIIIEPDKEEVIRKEVARIAEQRDISVTFITARTGVRRVLVAFFVDVRDVAELPDWMFVEMHHGVVSPYFKKPLQFVDLEFTMVEGLPVPTPEWRDVMVFRKMLKKRDFGACVKMYQQLVKSSIYDRVFKYPTDRAVQIERERSLPVDIDPAEPSWTRSVAKKLFLYTPFRKGRSFLFTIQGPDGVGKTTLINELEKIFSALPVDLDTFHHMSGWKSPGKARPMSGQGGELEAKAVETAFLLRKVVRMVYRLLPGKIQQYWLNFLAYIIYTSNVNNLIYAGRSSSTLFITDRYFDDRYMKMWMKDPVNCTHWMERLFGRVIERPRISFLLVDTPENIVARKQELTIDEIERLSTLLETSIHRRKGELCKIIVTDRSPRNIAVEIVHLILLSLDADVLPAIKSWKYKMDH